MELRSPYSGQRSPLRTQDPTPLPQGPLVSRRAALTGMAGMAGLAALVLAGCSTSGGTSGSAANVKAPTNQLVHAWTSDYTSLDPANTLGVDENQEIGVNIYERLLQFTFTPGDNGTLNGFGLDVTPQLATSWTVDGPKITFQLRDGVKFYPSGNPMTAEDVRYSLERMVMIPGNGQFQAGVAGLYHANQFKVINPRTIEVTTTNPAGKPTAVPVALASFRFQQFGIVDSKVVKSHASPDDPYAAKWMQNNVASTGRYYVDSHQPGQQVVLKAVPNHWSGSEPAFTTVVLRILGGADLVSLMKGGQIDYAAKGLAARQFDQLQSSGFTVLHGQTPNILRADLSLDAGPLSNVALRQAIAYAVPYDDIAKVVFAGRASVATSIVNPQAPQIDPAWAVYQKKDPAKATQLLADSGTPADFVLDIWYGTGVAYYEDVARLISSSLTSVGIKTKLQPRPPVQLIDLQQGRIHHTANDMSGMLITDGVIWLDDPDTTIDLWGKSTGDLNWSHYANPEVDKLHAEFRDSGDVAARTAAYKTIQEDMATAVGAIPVAVEGRTVVTNPHVTGVTYTPDPYARYEYLKPRQTT
jgi:peptide/nickel transport system substrate-binding protein